MKPQTITFNTGRLYAAHGQIITATLHADGVVTFMDHTRMVDGSYDTLGETFNAAQVMRAYDSSCNIDRARSFADGMNRDGVNSSTMNAAEIKGVSK
jgi:hypothetical protein